MRKELMAISVSVWVVAGCDTRGNFVHHDVQSASIRVAADDPAGLADIDIKTNMVADVPPGNSGPMALVAVERATLYDASNVAAELRVDFPVGFDRFVMGGDPERTASLVNIGTPNADLAELCGGTYDLVLGIAAASAKSFDVPQDSVVVEVTCQ